MAVTVRLAYALTLAVVCGGLYITVLSSTSRNDGGGGFGLAGFCNQISAKQNSAKQKSATAVRKQRVVHFPVTLRIDWCTKG